MDCHDWKHDRSYSLYFLRWWPMPFDFVRSWEFPTVHLAAVPGVICERGCAKYTPVAAKASAPWCRLCSFIVVIDGHGSSWINIPYTSLCIIIYHYTIFWGDEQPRIQAILVWNPGCQVEWSIRRCWDSLHELHCFLRPQTFQYKDFLQIPFNQLWEG